MKFFYEDAAGAEYIELSANNFAHAKARRLKLWDKIKLCAFDGWLHEYEIVEFSRKIKAKWLNKSEFVNKSAKVDLACALIEPASLNEIAPFLNELGLSTLYVVTCERSQRDYALDAKRLNKLRSILCNSSQQCARADIMQIICAASIEELEKLSGKKVVLIDFQAEKNCDFAPLNEIYLIGPEGGFSQAELDKYPSLKLKTKLILKAKTASVALASAMLI